MDKKNKGYKLGLYEKAMPESLSWDEKLANVNKFGFDYLEISIDETDKKLARLDMSKEERLELVQLMAKHDVKIQSMCLSGHRKYPLGSKDEATIKRSLEIMEKAIIFAQDLGVRVIQLAGYDVYYDKSDSETVVNFEKNLKIAVEMASQKGVVLAFETMETPFMNTVEKSMHYVNMINSPYLGVYPDIGNITNANLQYNTSVTDDILTGNGHIFAAHLKETVPNVFREVPFGTGHTDFIATITALKAVGTRMFVGEFWYIGADNWQQDCLDANTFLRARLDKVFSD